MKRFVCWLRGCDWYPDFGADEPGACRRCRTEETWPEYRFGSLWQRIRLAFSNARFWLTHHCANCNKRQWFDRCQCCCYGCMKDFIPF